jgi:hypothetical protein
VANLRNNGIYLEEQKKITELLVKTVGVEVDIRIGYILNIAQKRFSLFTGYSRVYKAPY